MRNVIEHFDKYKADFQGANNIGDTCDYFFVLYPNLIIECFNFVKMHLLQDERFKDFLSN
ncbi:unnamed protein product [Trifolium pratense]|uniref:Uncharacterized protein n=1 Tax=Trifolium pratense TaxID=57577 RepID=A0ACB0KFD9_TRIPR|nr:unnamed protein product [Trifolium pratense]